MEEYSELSQMFLGNLTTMSGGKLLKSKGMIYIEAESKGRKIDLALGKSIDIKFPSEKSDNENFQLFEGIQKGILVDWIPRKSESRPNQSFFKSNDEKFLELKYRESDGLNDALFTPAFCNTGCDTLKKYLRHIRYSKSRNNKGKIVLSVSINEFGELENIEIERGICKSVDTQILDAFNKIDDWVPALWNNVPHSSVRKYSILYKGIKGDFKIKRSAPLRRTKQKHMLHRDISAMLVKYKKEYAQEIKETKELNENMKNASFETISNIDESRIEGYILQSTKLDWINCDRFYSVPVKEKTNLYVKAKNEENVRLIFGGDVKSIMNSVNYGIIDSSSVLKFKNIPKKGVMTIVGIKSINGNPMLAFKQLSEIPKEPIELEYVEMTYAELKSKIGELDG